MSLRTCGFESHPGHHAPRHAARYLGGSVASRSCTRLRRVSPSRTSDSSLSTPRAPQRCGNPVPGARSLAVLTVAECATSVATPCVPLCCPTLLCPHSGRLLPPLRCVSQCRVSPLPRLCSVPRHHLSHATTTPCVPRPTPSHATTTPCVPRPHRRVSHAPTAVCPTPPPLPRPQPPCVPHPHLSHTPTLPTPPPHPHPRHPPRIPR